MHKRDNLESFYTVLMPLVQQSASVARIAHDAHGLSTSQAGLINLKSYPKLCGLATPHRACIAPACHAQCARGRAAHACNNVTTLSISGRVQCSNECGGESVDGTGSTGLPLET
jgi:hypothetical protein